MARRYESTPEREGELFSTISGVENEPLYSPENVEIDYERDLGWPGAYPFTRGVYPSMYRGRLWTMRQFAGFGTAEETNARFRYLLEHGQTGLSTAFDMPTLMGYDSDHPRSLGEVGREGVAIDSLADMETLFDGIPLGEVSTSMTINGPAAMLLAFYACVGEEQGVAARRAARHRPDGHPQGVHRAEGVDLPAARRRCGSSSTWSSGAREQHAAHAPGLDLRVPHPRGRLERRAGARVHARPTGSRYVEACLERGLDVDSFAPRLSFFFNAHLDFFEEIAKYRAARRIWARQMRDKYGAKDPRSLADALPHADRRRLADRAAAGGEPRSAPRSRRSRPCSAGRSRCTRTPSTRRSRCRPSTRCGSRCGRSR